ncbi:MAG: GDSL-type esterase/lipase family protein [Pseudomonadota bacterium]
MTGTINLTDRGPTDWAHWGREGIGMTMMASGNGAISNYTPLGGANPSRTTAVKARYSWSNGTPIETSTPANNGLRVFNPDAGFGVSVSAGVAAHTLELYVGARKANGILQFTLADGSAPPVVVAVNQPGGKSTRRVTVEFTPDNPTTLDITWTLSSTNGSGWMSLEAAALESGPPIGNQPPTFTSIADQTLVGGELLSVAVTTSDPDGPATTTLTATSDLPGADLTLTDNGDGTGLLEWPSTEDAIDSQPYTVTVTATDADGAATDEVFTVLVSAEQTGTLGGTATLAPARIDLSAVGADDWVHFAPTNSVPLVRKADGGNLISDMSPIDAAPFRSSGHRAIYSWNDGAPIVSDTSSRTGWRIQGEGNGFELTVAAGTSEQRLLLYLGINKSVGRVTAWLSDGSAMPLDFTFTDNKKRTYVAELNFTAGSDGETLTVRYELDTANNVNKSWVSLEAAAVQIARELSLPYSNDFESDLGDWRFVDEAQRASDWSIANGRLVQREPLGITGRAMQGALQVGSYAYLLGSEALANYRIQVRALGTAESAQDVGAILRLDANGDDHLRLSFSGANSFSRLEKYASGSVTTFASNARGYLPGDVNDWDIVADGPIVTVSIDGEKRFASYDTELSAGAVGLYCRDECEFDDFALLEPPGEPALFITTPAYTVFTTSTFTAAAVVTTAPAGATVAFAIAGAGGACGSTTQPSPGLFEASCTLPTNGNHSLTAQLFDSELNLLDTDTRDPLALGDSYVALGDSITAGTDDRTANDATSANGLVRGVQGFEAPLADALEADTGNPTVVANSGVAGDTSTTLLNERLDGFLQRYADANYVILSTGVNDAALDLPSGLGCTDAGCDGTYAGTMQDIVNAAATAGKGVIVPTLPPRFGVALGQPYADPATDVSNLLLRDGYNEVIRNQLQNITVGADFYDFFLGQENRFYLYQTNLHPNALGYRIMARMLRNSITGGTGLPWIATDLCRRPSTGAACSAPLVYKQNFVEIGDPLFIDMDARVTNMPSSFAEGRWIQTADSDRNRNNADFFSFDVDETVTLYVAYDERATSLPSWLAGFTPTALFITTNDPFTPRLDVYALTGVSGSVTLGGAEANAHGAFTNWIAVLIEE